MIKTKRLKLRTFVLEDKDFLYNLNNNRDVNKYLSYDSMSLEKCIKSIEGWIEDFKENTLNVYNIMLKDDNCSIGLIFLVKREKENKIELGYRLLPEYWGKGYCRESALALMSKFFNESDKSSIDAETHPENFNSVNFLLKLGFEEIYHNYNDRGRIFVLDRNTIIME